MNFKEALKQLEQSEKFQIWQKTNPDHYLAHGFRMFDGSEPQPWQIGFYNKGEDRIIVFTLDKELIQNPPSELFKKESGVSPLEVASITSDINEALEIADNHRKEKYKGNEPVKTIVLLQTLKTGQLWNISFITNTFAVCNIKIDSKSNKIISSACESLLGWGEQVKK